MLVTYKPIYSFLRVINCIMSDITLFSTYLDTRGYSITTIKRHQSYLIYFLLRLLENKKTVSYESIKAYRNDMRFYVSDNTVYKYLTSISAYIHYRNIIHNDYTFRKERIDYPKYTHKNWPAFYQKSSVFA